MAIPFLIMGSFALLIHNFPIDAYQGWLGAFSGGALSQLLATLYDISLGSLALILTITISFSFGRLAGTDGMFLYPLAAVTSYLAFCGGVWGQEEYIFSAEWVFTSMCITLLSCFLLRRSMELLHSLEKLHTIGADYLFNLSIQSLFPIILISLLFGVLGYILRLAWGNSNVTNFGSYIFLGIFDRIDGCLFGTLLYVLITHILWFLGIHGTNTLEMEKDMDEGERSGILPRYLDHSYVQNYYAQTLSMDLKSAMKRGKIQLFYQAQIQSGQKLHGAEALLHRVHLLQEKGIAFRMDDFGMGHTSMVRLLKSNQRSREIVSGIIQLSHTLNFRVIAEFVETRELQEPLEKLGCMLYQGYYYSRPLSPEDFRAYLKEKTWRACGLSGEKEEP